MRPYLQPNYFVDNDHEAVIDYARRHSDPRIRPIENAVGLYYVIRDGFRYTPWNVVAQPQAFKASAVAVRSKDQGAHCIDKAILLAACCRHLGIPSRMHYANVRNHIGTQDLERHLGTDLLVFHGYAELHLERRWVAATPAFNRELCELLGVAPLDFDGRSDSIFQQFDREGGRFMEYVHDYGHFPDLPFDLMVGEWRKYYPEFLARGWRREEARGG